MEREIVRTADTTHTRARVLTDSRTRLRQILGNRVVKTDDDVSAYTVSWLEEPRTGSYTHGGGRR